ncbi:hypothetical protein [Burkholderia gladioli]|uniref:hypothetical protein n=1 Tax=Burkholderia gladioli TaxID=28095 RepID=UPI001C5E20BE|nr:hypothetical protein [Burkholderia gladioli]MBW5287873.1 hypothetical protein [Burkholderia gladioli]
MKIRNPALERVLAQRAVLSAKHQGEQPSELLRKQIDEIDAREQEIDEVRAASAPPKKPVSLRDMGRVPVTLQPTTSEPASTPDLDAALANANGQDDGEA